MCLAKAFLGESELGEIILEDITRMQIEGNTIHLVTLFGESKDIEGSIKEVDFQGSKIMIAGSA